MLSVQRPTRGRVVFLTSIVVGTAQCYERTCNYFCLIIVHSTGKEGSQEENWLPSHQGSAVQKRRAKGEAVTAVL